MTMRYTECETLLKNAVNNNMRKAQRKATFQQLYSDYQQFFKMLINSNYIRSVSMNRYISVIDDLKRIRHILRHSSDERLRAIAKSEQKKINKQLQQLSAERKHMNYIVSLYHDAMPDMNRDAEQQLRKLMNQIYNLSATEEQKHSNTRFSDETIVRLLHESSKPYRNCKGELYNINNMDM